MSSFQNKMKSVKAFFTRDKKSRALNKSKPGVREETIHSLKDMEEMLSKKQEYLENLIEKELVIARQNGAKNKRAAIQALKRKRRYQRQLQQIDGTLTTLEMQRDNLEGTSTNVAVLNTMQAAAACMKEAQKHLDVEKIHDILDDIAEQQEIAKEVSDAIASPVYGNDSIDEEELEKELEELEAQDIAEELLKVDNVSISPLTEQSDKTSTQQPNLVIVADPFDTHGRRIPNTVSSRHGHKKPETEEDKELKELAEWAS